MFEGSILKCFLTELSLLSLHTSFTAGKQTIFINLLYLSNLEKKSYLLVLQMLNIKQVRKK